MLYIIPNIYINIYIFYDFLWVIDSHFYMPGCKKPPGTSPLKPLIMNPSVPYITVMCEGFQGQQTLNWAPVMPRDGSLWSGCTRQSKCVFVARKNTSLTPIYVATSWLWTWKSLHKYLLKNVQLTVFKFYILFSAWFEMVKHNSARC